jgi:pimeloyl-ACP methyl ester carboxylesterase
MDPHIRDVVALLERENHRGAILVGHSYAGMVITGVAEHARDRIAHLVYVDALVPEPEVGFGRRIRAAAPAVTVGRFRSWLLVSTRLPVKARPQDSRFAANEAAQQSLDAPVGAVPCSAHGVTESLGRGEQLFRDQRFEVAALVANAVLGHGHDAGVRLIAQQHADRL